jgi:hypothetical protein
LTALQLAEAISEKWRLRSFVVSQKPPLHSSLALPLPLAVKAEAFLDVFKCVRNNDVYRLLRTTFDRRLMLSRAAKSTGRSERAKPDGCLRSSRALYLVFTRPGLRCAISTNTDTCSTCRHVQLCKWIALPLHCTRVLRASIALLR